MKDKCACGVQFNAHGYIHHFRENHSCRYHVGVGCKVCKMIVDITIYLANHAAFEQFVAEREKRDA